MPTTREREIPSSLGALSLLPRREESPLARSSESDRPGSREGARKKREPDRDGTENEERGRESFP